MPFQIILVYNVQIYNVLYATYRIKLFYISIVVILNGIILVLCRFFTRRGLGARRKRIIVVLNILTVKWIPFDNSMVETVLPV